MVKILSYILVFLLGAGLATVAALRWAGAVAEAEVVAVEPVIRRVPVPDPAVAAELARVKAAQSGLTEELDAARVLLVERERSLGVAREALEELRRPLSEDVMSSALRAEMKSGEVIVTGGYRLPDGKRFYAFASPMWEQADGGRRVKVESHYVAVTDAAGASVGLDSLATNAANTLQHGEVWIADERRDVLARLAGAEGADVVELGALSIVPGTHGKIDAGGVLLRVTPESAGDGEGLNVELRLEQPAVPVSSGER